MPAKQPTPRFNPRGGERRGQRPLGGRPGASLWYGLAFLLLLGLAQMYYLSPGGRQIPYSDFKDLVKNGAIAEVTVGDQVIRGTLKEPAQSDQKQSKQFTTTRVEDPKLTEELEAKGVKYSGEIVNRWLPEVLGWIIPLVFFIGIWGFLFRVRQNGPYLVEGDDVTVVDWNGAAYQPAKRPFALCRCGGSTNKPFCDGTHSRIGFAAAEAAVGGSADKPAQ